MIRAAAKNWPFVAVATSPDDYEGIAREIEDGGVTAVTRRHLAAKAFARTAAYDAAIASFFEARIEPASGAAEGRWPFRYTPALERASELRYGENPHQSAAFYRWPGATRGLSGLRLLHGKALSYNNLLDLDAGWRLGMALEIGSAVVVKHRNPCGAAESDSIESAYADAWRSDSLSAFGGVVVLRGPVRAALARVLSEPFIELIAAESFEDEALTLLTVKKNLSLVASAELGAPPVIDPAERELRTVAGGVLVQEPDRPEPRSSMTFETVTSRGPTAAEQRALSFAWQVVRATQSNAIVLAQGTRTIGVGCGQTSRVDAVDSAIAKAERGGHPTRGAVMASDAFFPFADSVERAAAAGCTAVVQPGGSRRDAESIAAANHAGMAMVFTRRRCFRH
jgi:phosphoribosylaminoimidazolecarboxamide formyltransferase/IMP cyclohydrolase